MRERSTEYSRRIESRGSEPHGGELQGDEPRADRRTFLKSVGLATGAAGLSVASLAVTSGEAQAYDPGGDETRARYRLSDDVKAFYRTNGYETLAK